MLLLCYITHDTGSQVSFTYNSWYGRCFNAFSPPFTMWRRGFGGEAGRKRTGGLKGGIACTGHLLCPVTATSLTKSFNQPALSIIHQMKAFYSVSSHLNSSQLSTSQFPKFHLFPHHAGSIHRAALFTYMPRTSKSPIITLLDRIHVYLYI